MVPLKYASVDLGPMTLIYELDLGILKMYLHARIKLLGEGLQKLGRNRTETHRQTDATKRMTRLHEEMSAHQTFQTPRQRGAGSTTHVVASGDVLPAVPAVAVNRPDLNGQQ